MSTDIVRNLSDVDYHADRASLSSSGARLILDSPAKFRHRMDSPPETSDAFDLGHAVHTAVLGVGAATTTIPDDLLGAGGTTGTKAAKAFIADARERGLIPIKADVARQVDDMAAAVQAHPLAGALLSSGEPEVSVYAEHGSGVILRARPDWIRDGYVIDLKTTVDANPRAFGKTAANFGYHVQAAWYFDVLKAAGLADDHTRFLFALVEKTAPYLVSVVELDDESIDLGRAECEHAIRTYTHCTATGTWPGYPDDAPVVSLPGWYRPRLETTP